MLGERIKNIFISFIFVVGFLVTPVLFALEQTEKLWLALFSQKKLTQDQKWQAFFNSQFRFNNQSHPLQLFLLEGGLGYFFTSNNSLWMGYRWSGHRPYHGFFQENRIFEQYTWQSQSYKVSLNFRSRLEQFNRSDYNQIAIRLRERFAVEIEKEIFQSAFPYFYDEVFFQLNRTSYTSNKLITQNRLFIGINLYETKDAWWEIGYINQYEVKTPLRATNQIGHILSMTCYF